MKVVILFSKIDIYLPRAYERLHCKRVLRLVVHRQTHRHTVNLVSVGSVFIGAEMG